MTLKDAQMEMARYLRDPAVHPAPAGIEARRLKIYRDLVYNNIEGFISSGFPVLRSLYCDADWHALVQAFIDQHRCQTPYFLEISQEFLAFLERAHQLRPCDPPFLYELAHYEWVELGLDVAERTLPEPVAYDDIKLTVPELSPLAWLLVYEFPVHMIGPGYRPEIAEEPTCLVVYRDREDQVRFIAVNAAVARLLERVRDNTAGETAGQLLEALAVEMGAPPQSILEFGAEQLAEFVDLGVVLVRA
jgi:hypothetical protein